MGVVVISKSPPVVVKPSEPVMETSGEINLSSYDMWRVNTSDTVFLVFEHAIQDPVDTIKRAVSQALVHYYPLAGCLAAGATASEVVIKCSADGVYFVAASAKFSMKEVQDWSDPALKEELAMFYPEADGLCRYSDPLVMMQVTVFSCSGFILGVTWNHAVADGVGMGQFIQAIGELARGLPSPSVVPLRQGDSISLGQPPVFTEIVQFLGTFQPSQMVLLDFTVKQSLVNRVKDKYYATMDSGRPCTVFEAVAAVLWRCRTRAIMSESDPEALTVLMISTNARKYAGAKQGYYGNCVLRHLAMAMADAVADGDITDLVKMIQGTKDRVPDQSDLDQLLQLTNWYHLFLITSWRNIGFEAADFGAERPERVMGRQGPKRKVPRCTACVPCKDEYNVMSVCVKEDHAAAFLLELADMHLNYI
uniref:Uncharacterized protein n=1 Tax=Avena sativa TaxID=4498 RepID=A0ACD5ZCH5_AVESA